MPGRGPQTFKKRQKEQQRKEKQQEKVAKRLARKQEREGATDTQEPTDVEGATVEEAPESNAHDQ